MDENCRNFFNSRITLKHLYKQGFINKKGLLIDPERKNEILGFVQNANGKNKLIKKIKTLSILNMYKAKEGITEEITEEQKAAFEETLEKPQKEDELERYNIAI